jgi:hypothetical protein
MTSNSASIRAVLLRVGRHWPWVIGLAAFGVYASLGLAFEQRGLFYCQNVLFDADVTRVIDDLTTWHTSHHRTSVHPLFTLLTLPIGAELARWLSPAIIAVVAVALAGAGAVAVAGALLRRLLPEEEALTLTLVYASASSSLFMFSIIDTFAFSALAIAVLLYWARRELPLPQQLLARVLTFGTVTTNLVFVAIAEGWAPRRVASKVDWWALCVRSFALSVATVLVTAALALLGSRFIPNTHLFFDPAALSQERHYMPRFADAGDVLARVEYLLLSLVCHAWIVPRPRFYRNPDFGVDWATFTELRFTSYSALQALLALAVVALLVWASWSNLSSGANKPAKLAVGSSLAFHAALLFVYGHEFFLYTPLWMLQWILWIALALSEPLRRWKPSARMLLVLAAGLFTSNIATAKHITRHFDHALHCKHNNRACITRQYRLAETRAFEEQEAKEREREKRQKRNREERESGSTQGSYSFVSPADAGMGPPPPSARPKLAPIESSRSK